MRIAMVDPSLFTLPYDQALAAALRQAGHDVTLFGRPPRQDDGGVGDGRLIELFYRVAESGPVRALPRRLRLAAKGLDHVWSMLKLARRLRRMAPDVIHFQWMPLPLVDRRLLRLLRPIAPLVLTVHDTNPFNGDPSSGLQSRGFLGSFSRFERLIVHTEQGRQRLEGQGVAPARLVRIPHGAQSPSNGRGEDRMRGEITFVLFGKIKPYKGADLLLRAFAQVPAALRAQARVRIVGKSYMDLAPLRELIRESGIQDRCTLEPRFVDDDEIPGVFAPGTVAVFPYREIDTSGVLFQVLGFGRPLIASRLGAFAELLGPGQGGLLFEREDVGGLARALSRFIADRDFAAASCIGARQLGADAADWDEVACQTVAVYESVGRSGSAGARRATDISSRTRNSTGGNC